MTLSYLIGRRNAQNTPWTDERAALLVRLWAEGYSASEIADQIHDVQISRCSVIGKAHRLNLPARKARSHSVPKPPMPPPQPHPQPQPRPQPSPPGMRGLTLLELEPSSCRFPVEDAGLHAFFFCGADTFHGQVYCAFHDRLARARK